MNCPRCGGAARKVIYLALPMRLCEDAECVTLFGVWSFVAVWLPIATPDGFKFVTYSGAYLPALWHWLTVDE